MKWRKTGVGGCAALKSILGHPLLRIVYPFRFALIPHLCPPSQFFTTFLGISYLYSHGIHNSNEKSGTHLYRANT